MPFSKNLDASKALLNMEKSLEIEKTVIKMYYFCIMHPVIKLYKNSLILICFLLLHGALKAQVWLGINAGNSVRRYVSVCKNSTGESYTAIVENDSLYFQKKDLKQVVAPVKNKTNFNSIPAIACDNESAEHKDRIYICWSDEKNGINNKDVFIVYSDDKGLTWTEPILITYHPNHKDQFMPALFIDEAGTVYILYYDAQNYFAYGKTDVTMAVSKNGGLKFNYYQLNPTPVKQSLYIQTETSLLLKTERKKIIAGWRPSKKEPAEFAIFDEVFSTEIQKSNSPEVTFEKTVTFSDEIKIIYNCAADMEITAIITKPLLAGFEKIVLKNKKVKKGNNQLLIDTKRAGLKKDNYILTLYYNGKNAFAWITEN